MRSFRRLLLVCTLGGLAVALPALAQQASDYPAPCDASKVSKADIERAHTVFLSGKQYLEESNYDKAISYFKDAYSIDCSVHAMLPIIATAYERKGDKPEAIRALEEYLRRAPSAPDHDVIERRIRNLKDQVAREQAAAAASASAAPSSSPPPGSAAPAATPEPSPTPTPSALPAAPPSPPPAREAEGRSPLPWVVVGVGGATFLAGVVLYAVGAADITNALNTCKAALAQKMSTADPRSACPVQSAVDEGNNGRTLEQVGGPVIGAGLALAAAGVVWHFLDKPAERTGASSGTAGARLTPVLVPGYQGVAFRTAF
ncbi:MAG TPA: hypothetical protein VE987_15140 [Polyangiaceae bacterium]|nr:hypothetical protein [Polyangiaceae bacterium]